jgi:hypothetical protein
VQGIVVFEVGLTVERPATRNVAEYLAALLRCSGLAI